ncbi:MAG: MerR family transcriptional regulator [Candidatus Sericytochromatia bacterium]
MRTKYLIKDISELLDLNPKTIRFYEDEGIIPKAKRNKSNYRVYTTHDVNRIAFVKKARALGISIEDIKKIIAIREGGELPCCTVISILERNEKELEEKIQEMQNFKDKISHVIKNFKENIKVGKNGEICGLIENLFQE